jgi:DNA-directed RNA polymerase specialized sigma24 family protein
MLYEEVISDNNVESVEQIVINAMMVEKLSICIKQLSKADSKLINALFYKRMTEREFSEKSGIPRKTINDRKARILAHLRSLLETP